MVERKMAQGPGDEVVVIFSGQLSSSNYQAFHALGRTTLRIIINTHLLENGKAELFATATEAYGHSVWSDVIAFPVQNVGALATQVTKSIRKYGTHLFWTAFVAFYDSTGMPGVVFPPG
jgi:hypothetical protein